MIRRGADDYVFVLVPGGRQIDWPKLRAHLGVSRLSLPDAEEAKDGDRVRARDDHAVRLVERVARDRRRAIPQLDRVAIGGGGHGVNLHLAGADLVRYVDATVAHVTRPDADGTPAT